MEEKESVLLTEEGYKKLQEELAYLKGPKKMEVAEKIKIAREYGDLSENSEYDEAKNEQAILENKIAEMEQMLISAKIVNRVTTTKVGLGVSVTLYDYDFDEDVTYKIVASNEIDPMQNKISLESPIGRALFERKKGEDIEVEVPDGVSKYKILDIQKTL